MFVTPGAKSTTALCIAHTLPLESLLCLPLAQLPQLLCVLRTQHQSDNCLVHTGYVCQRCSDETGHTTPLSPLHVCTPGTSGTHALCTAHTIPLSWYSCTAHATPCNHFLFSHLVQLLLTFTLFMLCASALSVTTYTDLMSKNGAKQRPHASHKSNSSTIYAS